MAFFCNYRGKLMLFNGKNGDHYRKMGYFYVFNEI